jgi:bifunctional UDP-N-acetylglucosamine pyrophosphorylase / glucosamine-1-phosphate N-acetyltransferase
MTIPKNALAVVILAAGKGTRMKSDLLKVLHPLMGKPVLSYVLDTALRLRPQKNLLVVGYKAKRLITAFKEWPGIFVEQSPQLGTGHALRIAQQKMKTFRGTVLVLYGDVPLIEKETLKKVIRFHQRRRLVLTLLSTGLENPKGYGRIVRTPKGDLLKIVEEKDATAQERQIREINTGIYCFDSEFLAAALSKLTRKNRQREYYLTDLVQMARENDLPCSAVFHPRSEEVLGINDRNELAHSSQIVRQKLLQDWMLRGVTIVDPQSTYIEHPVKIGPDTTIGPFTVIRGKTRIGSSCEISSHVVIEDSEVRDGSKIPPFSFIKNQTFFP